MKRRLIAALTVSVIGFTGIAFNTKVSAASFDYTNMKTAKLWEASQWKNSDSVKAQLVDDIINSGSQNFKYEASNGHQYNYKKLKDAYLSGLNSGKSKTEAFNSALNNGDNYWIDDTSNVDDFDVYSVE